MIFMFVALQFPCFVLTETMSLGIDSGWAGGHARSATNRARCEAGAGHAGLEKRSDLAFAARSGAANAAQRSTLQTLSPPCPKECVVV